METQVMNPTPANGTGALATVEGVQEIEAGVIARQGFGTSEITRQAETAAISAAAAARAEVESRFIVAMQRPRDLLSVHARIVRECRRTGFAEVARYKLPRGGKTIEGASIRFAEAAARNMGNLDIRTMVISDTETRQIVKAIVTDLETNATYSDDLVIEKFVERSFVKEGQRVLGERINSAGKKAYLVDATEADIRTKRAAEISKAIRTLILRVVPGDIVDDAMDQVVKTLRKNAEEDPDREKKRILGAFLDIGIKPEQLAEYLGHPIDSATSTELVDLVAIGRSLKEGQTTWEALVSDRAAKLAEDRAKKVAEEGAKDPGFVAKKTAAQKLAEKVTGKAEPATPAQTELKAE